MHVLFHSLLRVPAYRLVCLGAGRLSQLNRTFPWLLQGERLNKVHHKVRRKVFNKPHHPFRRKCAPCSSNRMQTKKSVVLVAGIALKDSSTLSAYTVIVGSYTLPEKSIDLINKLKGKSLSPFFVRNEKGMYHLVAGTFSNKDDADF